MFTVKLQTTSVAILLAMASLLLSLHCMERASAFSSHPIIHINSPLITTNTCTGSISSLDMAQNPNESLRNEILSGVALKLKTKQDGSGGSGAIAMPDDETMLTNVSRVSRDLTTSNSTYFVREACRSEIDEITDMLMKAFHPQSEPLFDSYIRKYKYNHLQLCFDAIPTHDRGLFVACEHHTSIPVGFVCVDGRPNDPSSRIEFLTPSTLVTTTPRPYLSDLGVLPSHRRKGIGRSLVVACEEWVSSRGYDTLYLKVDERNGSTMKLYGGMGYVRSKLPGIAVSGGGKKWGNDVLLEKKIGVRESKRKKSWVPRVWRKKSTQTSL